MNKDDVIYVGRLLLRRLPLLILAAMLGLAAGAALAEWLPRTYRATATLVVEAARIPAQLARSSVTGSAIAHVEVLQRQLLSERALLELAERFALYGETARLTPAEVRTDLRGRLSFEQIKLGSGGEAIVAIAISFEATSSALAAAVANHLADTVLASDEERRSSGAAETLEFFSTEAEQLTERLESLDAQILSFKNRNLDALPESLPFRRNQQIQFQQQLLLLDEEEGALHSRRDNMMALFQSTGRIADRQPQTPEGQLLDDLKVSLAGQLLVFSPDSASVVGLRQRIAAVEQELQAVSGGPTAEPSLPFELEMQLDEIDQRLAALHGQRQDIADAIAALDLSIRSTPQNETTLNTLLRERGTIEAQQSAARALVAEASIGAQIESRLKGERLVLLEAASPPPYAEGPRRLILVAGGGAGGMLAALGGLIVAHLFDRRVGRAIDMKRALDIEALAVLPAVRGVSRARRGALLMALAPVAGTESEAARWRP